MITKEQQESEVKKHLANKLKGLDNFLNWTWATGDIYLSKNLFEIMPEYIGKVKRNLILDEFLDDGTFRVFEMYNMFANQRQNNVVLNIADIGVFTDEFSNDEWKVVDELVTLGMAAFNTMARKHRDEYKVEKLYPVIKAKLTVKNNSI